jgi:S-adenosylmethionine-diacylglycerol 3-amino-3-carboxypropyl transferase
MVDTSEISSRADFSIIRYAQCWEDADTVLAALNVQPGDVCLSVGSGGENSLSLLSRSPAKVIAVDISHAQNACIELKATGFRVLTYPDLLELVGVRSSTRRPQLYDGIRKHLTDPARKYWDANREVIDRGMISAGKFENYFALFRNWVLPIIHSRRTVAALLEPRTPAERQRFYDERWNNRRWRALFHLFFSRYMMGRLGRDPQFFAYVDGQVAKPIFNRTEHALTQLDTSRNPYLAWITSGKFANTLPHAWREENFDAIRANIDRLEIRLESAKSFIAGAEDASIDRFNLSDIFEYIPVEASDQLFEQIVRCGRRGGRMAYWNTEAPRRSPASLAHRVCRLDELSRQLHGETKTFFYCAFYVEELQ